MRIRSPGRCDYSASPRATDPNPPIHTHQIKRETAQPPRLKNQVRRREKAAIYSNS
jgi:hypothetical protein